MAKDYDFSKRLEESKNVDLSNIDFNAIINKTSKSLVDSVDMKQVNAGLEGVFEDDANIRKMNNVQSISGIANINDAVKREEALNLLGLSETRNHLYIFISYSMPEDMIRAYAREAFWAGATLVVKGLEEGEEIMDFVQKKAHPLVEGKGYMASLNIDPRMFDAFDIQYVPSIVLSNDPYLEYCKPSDELLTDFNVTRRCEKRPENTYIKISGAITLDYALEQFIEEGTFLDSANERLTALRESIGKSSLTEQVSEYHFDDNLEPSQKDKIKKAYSKFGEVIETEYGLSVIPFAPPERTGVHYKRHEKTKE